MTSVRKRDYRPSRHKRGKNQGKDIEIKAFGVLDVYGYLNSLRGKDKLDFCWKYLMKSENLVILSNRVHSPISELIGFSGSFGISLANILASSLCNYENNILGLLACRLIRLKISVSPVEDFNGEWMMAFVPKEMNVNFPTFEFIMGWKHKVFVKTNEPLELDFVPEKDDKTFTYISLGEIIGNIIISYQSKDPCLEVNKFYHPYDVKVKICGEVAYTQKHYDLNNSVPKDDVIDNLYGVFGYIINPSQSCAVSKYNKFHSTRTDEKGVHLNINGEVSHLVLDQVDLDMKKMSLDD